MSRSTLRFLVFLTVIVLCLSIGRFFHFDPTQFNAWLSKIPVALSGLIFIVLYVVLTTLVWVGPNDVLRITSAVLFGPLLSTVLVYIAEMFQAGLFFHLSRKLGRGFVQERFHLKPVDLEKVKSHSGYLGIFVLRINPLIPYRFLDLAYGLSRVSFQRYFFVALIASFPRIFWLQFLLAAVGSSILNNPQAFFPTIIQYLTNHPREFLLSSLYLLFVIVVTLFAGVIKMVGRIRKSHRDT